MPDATSSPDGRRCRLCALARRGCAPAKAMPARLQERPWVAIGLSRASTLPQGQGGDLVFVGAALAAMLLHANALPHCRCGNQAAIGGLGGLDGLLSLPLSSGLPSPSLLAVN